MWHPGMVTLAALAALTGCAATQIDRPPPVSPSATTSASAASVATSSADPVGQVTEYEDLAYGPAVPGNLLDIYVPDGAGDAELPLLIWHTGSGWGNNDVKEVGEEIAVVEEFTARGYAVASINIRSSLEARYPAQGFDVRAAIRYLRENAATYGIDPGPIRVHGQLVWRVGDSFRSHDR